MPPWKCLKCEADNSETSERCEVCDRPRTPIPSGDPGLLDSTAEVTPRHAITRSPILEPRKLNNRAVLWVVGAAILAMIWFLVLRPAPQPAPASQPQQISPAPVSTPTSSPDPGATDIASAASARSTATAREYPTQTAIAVQTFAAQQETFDRITATARAIASARQTLTMSAERTTTAEIAKLAQSTSVGRSAMTAQAHHTATAYAAMTSVARQTETGRSTSNTAQAMATQNAMSTRTAQARATSTPSPRPARCQIDVDPRFTAVWVQAGGTAVGCPVGSAYSRRVAFQEFQNGFMLWRASPTKDAGGMIYVLYRSGDWQEYSDEWVDGMPANGEYSAPSGLMEPQRGFGQLWRKLGGPNAAIGWALSPEQGSDFGLLQDFSNNAVVFQFPNKITAFMPDGKRWR